MLVDKQTSLRLFGLLFVRGVFASAFAVLCVGFRLGVFLIVHTRRTGTSKLRTKHCHDCRHTYKKKPVYLSFCYVFYFFFYSV